jgi:hypothetical protein
MQNLEPIRIFITVAEMGSFTHAADSLGIQKGRASTARRSSDRGGTDNDRAGLTGFHGDSSRVGAGGVEYGSASRSGSRGVRLCIAAWTHWGRDADCPPIGPVAHGQRCQSRLSCALWRPSIAGRSPAPGTPDNSLWDDAGRKTLWMGISGRRKLRDTSVARCAARQQRTNLRSRCPRRSWPDSGPTSWDWPILGEWSAGGNSTRLWSPVACRVPRSSASAQPVAPSPRIHEMDRRCARALSRIAKRIASSGPRCQRRSNFRPLGRSKSRPVAMMS